MAILAILIGICLTVIGLIDGLVAFWNRISGYTPAYSIPADVVKVLVYNRKKYVVKQEHISKFGAKLFDDVDGVPVNRTCIAILDTLQEQHGAVPSIIEPHFSQRTRMFLMNVADAIRDIDSEWDDVNQIIFGTGMVFIGFGLLMLSIPVGILFVFFGAFKVM